MRNYFKSGSWNITCDRCSKKTKADEIKKEWTGFLVCPVCFEHRHPQDFVRARQDKISVPFTRPRPVDVFTNILYPPPDGNYCTATGTQAISSLGIPGCMIPNKNTLGI